MRFSLMALLGASTIVAWLLGTLLSGNYYAMTMAVFFQYLVLAICVAFAIVSRDSRPIFATCFAAGYMSWSLLIIVESWCAPLSFSETTVGEMIRSIADWASNTNSSINARMKVNNYQLTTAFVRTTLGTLVGIITYFACVMLTWKEKPEP